LSGFYEGHALPAHDGEQVKATLKWFNPVKGFGFVTPDDGQGDAFLHVSVLSATGMEELAEGTEMTCQIGPGAKGRQVTRIIEILGVNPNFTPAPKQGGFGGGRDRDNGFGGGRRDFQRNDYGSGEEMQTTGTVKWFKQDKGFGFVAGDDNGKDIFVHKSLLRRCDVMVLDTNMRVEIRCRDSDKGREATWIRVIG
jgi:CspA family cold shock protein